MVSHGLLVIVNSDSHSCLEQLSANYHTHSVSSVLRLPSGETVFLHGLFLFLHNVSDYPCYDMFLCYVY